MPKIARRFGCGHPALGPADRSRFARPPGNASCISVNFDFSSITAEHLTKKGRPSSSKDDPFFFCLVGVRRFELPAPASRRQFDTRLLSRAYRIKRIRTITYGHVRSRWVTLRHVGSLSHCGNIVAALPSGMDLAIPRFFAINRNSHPTGV